MQAFFFTSATGWSLVVMSALTIAFPFLLRRQLRSPQLRLRWEKGRTFLKRMRPHYWIGYAIAAVTLVHAVLAMGAGLAKGANLLGLLLACAALFLVFGQVLLGQSLRKPGAPSRRRLRRVHLVMMLTIVALGLGHIVLDSPTLQGLIR